MPYKQQIAEAERAIEELLATITTMRERGSGATTIEPLLTKLARLRAERLRLMERQALFSK
jgi:hypothetical protein